jgi:hypothetical protein
MDRSAGARAFVAGATVLRGMMGFGARTHQIRTFRFDTLSEDLPIIGIVTLPEKLEKFLSLLSRRRREWSRYQVIRKHENIPSSNLAYASLVASALIASRIIRPLFQVFAAAVIFDQAESNLSCQADLSALPSLGVARRRPGIWRNG